LIVTTYFLDNSLLYVEPTSSFEEQINEL
jgi:hypothetical protein